MPYGTSFRYERRHAVSPYGIAERSEAIRSLGAYLHNAKVVSHLNSVIHESNNYPKELRIVAIKVLGER